eukprot:9603576-Lingulodinium_polyedra.AAC.1
MRHGSTLCQVHIIRITPHAHMSRIDRAATGHATHAFSTTWTHCFEQLQVAHGQYTTGHT